MKHLLLTTIASVALVGCGKGWELDYGHPAAQFQQEDLASKGKAFVGKHITVKGTVTKVDISNPKSARIHLMRGIECNLGKFKAMAGSCKIGDTVCVGGFLKRCEEDDILMDPAILRDPNAQFKSAELVDDDSSKTATELTAAGK